MPYYLLIAIHRILVHSDIQVRKHLLNILFKTNSFIQYFELAEDGCLEEFENTAAFSREYQSSQECMCDTEHMFDCPGNTDENELETLARSIQNEGMMDSTLDKIVNNIQTDSSEHKVVAKKFFSKKVSHGI